MPLKVNFEIPRITTEGFYMETDYARLQHMFRIDWNQLKARFTPGSEPPVEFDFISERTGIVVQMSYDREETDDYSCKRILHYRGNMPDDGSRYVGWDIVVQIAQSVD